MSDSLLIVVVTCNAAERLDTCLGPLADMPENWTLVIVDDASRDGTISLAREKAPKARIIESDVTLGFGRASNLGLQLALTERAAHILLLNQDACISIAEISRLIELQKNNPEYAVISPALLDTDGANTDAGFADSMLPQNSDGIMADSLDGASAQLYPTMFVPAAVWLLSRQCLQTVGGFSPTFFHCGEDTNYLQRVAFHGLKCGIAPGVFARFCRPQGAESKASGKSYTDEVIRLSDPFTPVPGKIRVAFRAALQSTSLFLGGHREHAAFVWREHGGLFRENCLLEARKRSLEKGASFVGAINDGSKKIVTKYKIFGITYAKARCTDWYSHYSILKFVTILRRKSNISLQQAIDKIKNSRLPVVVYFDQDRGGGTASYFFNVKNEKKNDTVVIRIVYDRFIKKYLLSVYMGCNRFDCIFSLSDIFTLINIIKTVNIALNHLGLYTEVKDVLNNISWLKNKNSDVTITVMLHDYYMICHRYTLLNDKNEYCGLKNFDECSIYCQTDKKLCSGEEWRAMWRKFFTNTVDEIVAFSQSSRDIFVGIYPETERIVQIVPHKYNFLRQVNIKKHDDLTIGIIGNISNPAKGSDILRKMEAILPEGVRMHLIGQWSDDTIDIPANLPQTGTYDVSSLPDIVEKLGIDIIFIPSVWPETFSYTTVESISMGLPVACFAIGAQMEHVRNYEHGLVISKIDAKTCIDEMMVFHNRIMA
ncbi:glycosyltransferase [Desulfovibrio sp. OttesenSCG-928-I05]|nr:glycosyltransferase [Desulfovibrio sp. OttesenSCG-928-I05]